MGLTTAQAIGIGVAVGFVGALSLMVILLCISRCSSAETVPSGPIIIPAGTPPPVKQPKPNPQVLTTPRDPASFRNPITNSHRTLSDRVEVFRTVHQISQGVDFEKKLRTFVENFIINSHHREQPRVSPSIFDEEELVRLAGEPANGGTWSETISNVATRGAAVKCFLAQLIFKRMHPSCPLQESLLAPEISSCYQLVCRIYQNPGRENIIGVWRECQTLEKAANSAMILLGQPSEWEAVWTSPEPGFIVFSEVRLTWNSKTKYSKPAEVDVTVPKPVPSDNHDQPHAATGGQHSSDVGCQSDADADEQQKHFGAQALSLDTFQQSGAGNAD
ncbi:hypothetical protein NCS52_01281200 [Fusarium sp. LHS14.1]|nr:hypothetical protein NCS52_01281200 [Fusarium sp. LHS14.1]